MTVISLAKYSCDYCEKSESEVQILITGPKDAAICNEGVAICLKIIEEASSKTDKESK